MSRVSPPCACLIAVGGVSGNAERMFSDKYPGHMKYLAGINAKDMDSWVFEEAQVRTPQANTTTGAPNRHLTGQIFSKTVEISELCWCIDQMRAIIPIIYLS